MYRSSSERRFQKVCISRRGNHASPSRKMTPRFIGGLQNQGSTKENITSSINRGATKGGCLPQLADHYNMNRTPTLSQKFLAELLGTAFLVWVGPGSITTTNFIAGGKVPFTMADL